MTTNRSIYQVSSHEKEDRFTLRRALLLTIPVNPKALTKKEKRKLKREKLEARERKWEEEAERVRDVDLTSPDCVNVAHSSVSEVEGQGYLDYSDFDDLADLGI